MNTFISGAAFGAALTVSGVHQPSAIVAQLTLSDWHMMQTFLTATASSSLVVAIARQLKQHSLELSPRNPSNLGLVSQYDGNFIGGMLLGAGMAMAGACPGTVLSQVAVGIRSGFYAFGGALIAGTAWAGILKAIVPRQPPAQDSSNDTQTWYDALHIGHGVAVLGSQLLYVAAIATTLTLSASGDGRWNWAGVTGGIGIGVTQLLSLVARGKLVGVSGCYEQVGDWVWMHFRGEKNQRKTDAMVFATGVVSGAWVLARLNPSLADVTVMRISPLFGFTGGFLMTLGAQIAGGCTSGHGISGMSLLSTSSLVTISTAMATGAAVATSLYS